MAISNANEQLLEDIKSGMVDPVALRKTVDSMGITDSAKLEIHRAIAFAEEETNGIPLRDRVPAPSKAQEPAVDAVQVPEQSPASPAASTEGGSFLPEPPVREQEPAGSLLSDVTVETGVPGMPVEKGQLSKPRYLSEQTPAANVPVRDFFSPAPQQVSTFFDFQPERVQLPKDEVTAAELGSLIASQVSTEPEEQEMLAEQASNELQAIGTTGLWLDVQEKRRAEQNKSRLERTFENMDFLKLAQQYPEKARAKLAEEDEMEAIMEQRTAEADLFKSTIGRLTPDQLKVYTDIEFITDEILGQRLLYAELKDMSASENEKADAADYISSIMAAVTGASIVTSRVDQGKLANVLKDAVGDVDTYGFKSEHAEKVIARLTDPSRKIDDIREDLVFMRNTLAEMDVRGQRINPLWNVEYFDMLLSELHNAEGDITLAEFNDAMDATVVGAVLVRPITKLATAATEFSRSFFGTAMRASSPTHEQLKEYAELVKRAVNDFKPSDKQSDINVPVPEIGEGVERSGAVIDAINATNPTAAAVAVRTALQKGQQGLHSLGVTAAQLVQRILPNSSGNGMHSGVVTGNSGNLPNKFNAALDNLNTSDLLTNEELNDVPEKFARRIAEQSNATLYVADSKIEAPSTTSMNPNGSLNITAVFGKSSTKGYATQKDAEDAAVYLFGTDYEVVAKVSNPKRGDKGLLPINTPSLAGYPDKRKSYFIRAKSTLTPDTSFVNPLEQDWMTPSVPFNSYAQTWFKTIDNRITQGLSAFQDKAQRVTDIVRQSVEPYLRMGAGRDKEDVTRLLISGDQQEHVFKSKQEAEAFLGRRISKAAYEGYLGVRNLFDNIAEIRNRSVYRTLNQNGYKSVYTQGGILEDLGDKVHVYPISAKPEIIARPEEGDALFKPTGVWGSNVYDTTTGQRVPLNQQLLDDVYQSSDRMIVRAHREAEFIAGQSNTFLVVKTSDIKPLTRNPMTKRVGHIDTDYKPEDTLLTKALDRTANKGGTMFKVEQRYKKDVDGDMVERTATVGLYANRAQAIEGRARAIQADIDALGYTPSAKELKEIEEGYLEPVMSREGEYTMGIEASSSLSGLPAHSKRRGDRLAGPNGAAEVLNIEEAMTKAIAEVERHLKIDAVTVMKQRYDKTYGRHYTNYNGFPASFDAGAFRKEGYAPSLAEGAGRAHRFISSLEHAISNREYVMFMDRLNHYAEDLIDRGIQIPGELVRQVGKARLDIELKKVVSLLLIGGRPLYQVVANGTQSYMLLTHSPVTFALDTIRRTIATAFFGLPRTNIMGAVADQIGAAIAGMTVPQFKKHVQNLKASGILRSGAAQDVANLFGESGKVEAGRHNMMASSFWKRMVPGLGLGDRLGKTLMIPQHLATDLTNLMAYNHAMSVRAKEIGLDATLSRRGSVEVSGLTRRLMFQQNRIDQFAYQQNAASMMLMFFQHVHRMYMDTLIDPMVRVSTGNKVRLSKDGSNPYAYNWVSSVKTMAMMSGLFGIGAYPFFDENKNELSKQALDAGFDPLIVSAVFNGTISAAAQKATGESLDFAARFGPAGALQNTLGMMFTDEGAIMLGGPMRELWKTGKNATILFEAANSSEGEDIEVVFDLAKVVARTAIPHFNDQDRALVAKNLGEYIDRSGRMVSDVTDTSSLFMMFSVPPHVAETVYDERNKVKSRKEQALLFANLANRYIVTEVAAKKDGDQDGEFIMNEVVRAVKMIHLMAGKDKSLATQASEEFLTNVGFSSEGALVGLAEKIVETSEPQDAIEKIRNLQIANPKNAELYEQIIQAIEMQLQ